VTVRRAWRSNKKAATFVERPRLLFVGEVYERVTSLQRNLVPQHPAKPDLQKAETRSRDAIAPQ